MPSAKKGSEVIMRARYAVILAVLFVLLLANASTVAADTVKLKDGTKFEGTINKIESGKVLLSIKDETKVVNLADVESMDFTDQRLKDTETKEIARNLEELDKTAGQLRQLLNQIEGYWAASEPIDAKNEGGWEAAKATFRQPVTRYQEILNDLYFHVMARVDQYNALMKDASKVYVGVKGLRAGSPLIPSELEQLPLKKYVPGAWYDTIFNDGYNLGYSDAMQKINLPRTTY
jgi:hypothetical protein